MTTHELAKKLLEQPDVPAVLVNKSRDKYCPVVVVEVVEGHPWLGDNLMGGFDYTTRGKVLLISASISSSHLIPD